MGAQKTIIVVGGAHGGPSAAARARQVNENARIILVEQAPFVTWVQASLRYHLIGDEQAILSAIEREERYFAKRYDVEVMTNTQAMSFDLDASVLVVSRAGKLSRIRFDALVYAGGSISLELNLPELKGPRVVNFRNFADIQGIKKAVAEGARKVCVVGCGFYGTDAAIGLAHLGLEVTMIEAKKRIMPRFSMAFAQSIYEKLTSLDIEILLDTHVEAARPLGNGGFELKLSHDRVLEADLVVVCVGILPRTSLLAEAGAALDPSGQVRVDDTMATTLPNVFACGSAVSVPYAVTNERKWVPQPAIVMRTAHVAGANAAQPDGHLDRIGVFSGTLITHIKDVVFARTGLSEEEARSLFGDDSILVTTVFGSASEAWITKQEMCVRLVVNKKTRTIVGGEVFGTKGVERRIDLLSVAVLESWMPEKLSSLDMAYFADSGPPFDPLKDAAFRARMALNDDIQILSADQLALWLQTNKDFRLVDVGESSLFSVRLPVKTMHIPLENLRERIDELGPESSPIVLFSESGFRSYLAQRALKQRGLFNVYHLDGGAQTWKLISG